jgi:hypothetical protein
MMKILPALAALTAACTPAREPSAVAPPPSAASAASTAVRPPVSNEATWLGFPAYPGAREVCGQSVLGTTGDGSRMEIHWTMYASADSLEAVRRFYVDQRRALSADELRNGDEVLSVHARGTSYPTCGHDPEPATTTVFIVSRANR